MIKKDALGTIPVWDIKFIDLDHLVQSSETSQKICSFFGLTTALKCETLWLIPSEDIKG